MYSSPVRYGEDNGRTNWCIPIKDRETHLSKVWADWDASNFAPSKNGMTVWASAAK